MAENQLPPILEAKLKNVSGAIVNNPPLCSGTWELPPESFHLFYKTGDDSARWIDLLHTTEPQLESLAKACTPATFGVDDKDVLDLSYRKAGKMDVSDFLPRFDPERVGLSEFVHGQLLEGDHASKGMRTELYKLNVYGKDAFFKAHKDTPRSMDMIGSLVVVLPTSHEGGTLILRHNGREYTFDSGLELSRVKKPSIAYIAFYSDVEHEVTIVESGHRVTLTYNLYVYDVPKKKDQDEDYEDEDEDEDEQVGEQHGEQGGKKGQQPEVSSVPSDFFMFNELQLKQALSELLDEKTFLPEGGTIGFGLLHKYPISKTKASLKKVLTCLKGSDAVIHRVCTSLGLEPTPHVIYKEQYGECLMLVDQFIDLGIVDTLMEERICTEDHGGYWFEGNGFILQSRGLKENGGGEFERKQSRPNEPEYQFKEVWWLTKRTELTRERTDFVAYGNDAQVVHTYGDVVLIASMGPHGNRQGDPPAHRRKRRRVGAQTHPLNPFNPVIPLSTLFGMGGHGF